MIPQGKRKSTTVSLAAAVLLTCYLTQTIDCYRLRKTERREGRKEAEAAKTIGVREGTIVFGRVFEKGSGLPSQESTKKSNSSGEDEAAYQADFTGFPQSQTHANSKEATAWGRMSHSLHCGADQLRFRAMGPGASQFAVEQAHAAPMPLSQVPSTCGYNMQRNSLALVMLVPFDGCNMLQEGGNYVLPMRWQGVPVSLLCPKPAAPHQATTAMPTHPTKPGMPQYPQYPSVFPPYPMFPYFPSLPVTTTAQTTTTAVPTTTKSTSTTAKPATTAPPPRFPFPVYPPFYPPFPWPFPGLVTTTTTPTTTSTTTTTTTTPPPPPVTNTTARPQQPPFPFMPFPFPFPFPPSYPLPFFPPPMPYVPQFPAAEPEMTTTQTTTPTTTPTTTTETPTTTTTTTTTTTAKTDPPVTSSLTTHYHPHDHYFPFPLYPPPYNFLQG